MTSFIPTAAPTARLTDLEVRTAVLEGLRQEAPAVSIGYIASDWLELIPISDSAMVISSGMPAPPNSSGAPRPPQPASQ